MSWFDPDKHLRPLIALGLTLVFLGAFLAWDGYSRMLENLDRKIAASRKDIVKFGEEVGKYRALESQLRAMSTSTRGAGADSLISTVENAADRINARSQLLYVRPQPDKPHDGIVEEGVEIRLEKLQLDQLVELLHLFEQTGRSLRVSQLRIRTRFDNPEQLDTSMILSRFRETAS